jgi:hypothetical protein
MKICNTKIVLQIINGLKSTDLKRARGTEREKERKKERKKRERVRGTEKEREIERERKKERTNEERDREGKRVEVYGRGLHAIAESLKRKRNCMT